MNVQIVQTLITLLFQKKPDRGLHLLSMHFFCNFKTFSIMKLYTDSSRPMDLLLP